MYDKFHDDIKKFNEMYSLPYNDRPKYLGDLRLVNFYNTLSDEIEEVDDIYSKESDEEALIALADWLGDIIVYCASEAAKHGIPIGPVVKAIMDSNFTKLGADGKPIVDEAGKVQKGPGYRKPEPLIEMILTAARAREKHARV